MRCRRSSTASTAAEASNTEQRECAGCGNGACDQDGDASGHITGDDITCATNVGVANTDAAISVDAEAGAGKVEAAT